MKEKNAPASVVSRREKCLVVIEGKIDPTPVVRGRKTDAVLVVRKRKNPYQGSMWENNEVGGQHGWGPLAEYPRHETTATSQFFSFSVAVPLPPALQCWFLPIPRLQIQWQFRANFWLYTGLCVTCS